MQNDRPTPVLDADLARKIDLLLAGGSLAVWVIYPELREVRVFSPDGTSYTRRGDETLTLPELGKFALSVLGVSWAQIRAKIVKALGPSGETIMKSRIMVNCRKARMAIRKT